MTRVGCRTRAAEIDGSYRKRGTLSCFGAVASPLAHHYACSPSSRSLSD
ncbi:hypothetical protein KCP77_22600 [Salmonella enterica subsp. enterica]|nr:hypothetical protein KCP77_22600 [Salmonella enterica subsp. enterica]